MSEDPKLLKNVYNRAYIERLAMSLVEAGVSLDKVSFCDAVINPDWAKMELKERTTHICLKMAEVLPANFEKACEVLIEAGKSFGGYEGMFFPEYVERFGLDHWDTSLKTLETLTVYSSAEFAIRPFLEKDPEEGAKQMLTWSSHKNEHVRRLASEGIRPRLPWASQLRYFKEDPTLIFIILDKLKEDESLYVRKSVANNLNDISKDHPEDALKWSKGVIKDQHPHTIWIVKHGMRTLLKQGEEEALGLFGYAGKKDFKVDAFDFFQKDVAMGETLSFDFSLTVKKKGKYRFEYALYFLKKNGGFTKKVFKISEHELEQGEYEVDKDHLFKKINTRKYYEGIHFVEPIINGMGIGKKSFYLWLKRPAYVVYMLLTQKNTIYCGITTDMGRRFREHCGEGKGAKYTKANKPEELIYLEAHEDRSSASKREAALKKLKRPEKERISFLNLLK